MKRTIGAGLLVGAISAAAIAAESSKPAPSSKPDWAYAIPLPGQPALPQIHENGKPYGVPGSKLRFTKNKVGGISDDGKRSRVSPADWFPNEHPRMPKIVAEGDGARKITACSLCHSPSGKGRPQNAHIAGLPAEYFAAQLRDMKNGLRRSAEPKKKNAGEMVDFARAMTEREIEEAARYYAAIPWSNTIRVVETDTVPKTVSADGMMLPLAGNAKEKLGNRIVETPADVARTDLRDPHATWIAYVPRGAVARGRQLATNGKGDKTLACAVCHGPNLMGVGPIPGIAGRSPYYIARQLYDMQRGTRRGVMAQLMKPVVAKLSAQDILNLAAYTASVPVPPPGRR
jgi:cytochrome c553